MADSVDVAEKAGGEVTEQPAPESRQPEQPSPLHPQQPAPKPAWRRTVARQTTAAASKLAPLAQRTADTVAGASPMTLVLALLGFLLALSIIASLAFDDALGVASAILFVPALSAAVGAAGMRWFDGHRTDAALSEDAGRKESSMQNLEHTLDYVDTKLTGALGQFGTDRHNDAVIAMFQAKAATELYLGPAPSQGSTTEDPAPTRHPLADYLTPNALIRTEHSDRPAGLSLI